MIRFKHNPCDSTRITVKYGYDKNYINDSFHNGLDIGALTPGVEGDPLYAVDDGVIKFNRYSSPSAGNYVVLECEKYTARYLHMQKIIVSVGQKVKAGDVIGYMGNTGVSTGPHLHLEIKTCKYHDKYYWKKDGKGRYIKAINPENLLIRDNELEQRVKIYKECFENIREILERVDQGD